MNPPDLNTRIMGSRLVAPVVMATSAFITYLWWVDGCQNMLGIFMICIFAASANAMKQVAAYREWQQAWDAMVPGEIAAKRRKQRAFIGTLIVAILAFGGIMLASRPAAAPYLHEWGMPLIVVGGLLGAAWLVIRLLWWVWSRWRRHRSLLVAVAVKRPVVHVPSLQTAYQRLPSYCQPLLKGRS
ncbi:hypothetical protein [Asticcacaulis benevestitus]|uniref:Uncharacterized protein n=1 Tax=Asticcacaulis benevestitus DSM 16100 = ATCC BAA-896 TaxID=1121022 RepID=V4P4H5_9CAUL|nr:hypothetical protein [Asticcacaulis benevestitus]ESQ82996.1 hypothetical protein ABENE_20525 [Asticcacaulis benevestitus DSM 16100 = ATCC BAA-896]